MVLLGDVREAQSMGEGASDAKRHGFRQRAHQIGELVERTIVAGMGALGECADALDAIEQLGAVVNFQHLPQQIAELPDVVSERLMPIGHDLEACCARQQDFCSCPLHRWGRVVLGQTDRRPDSRIIGPPVPPALRR